MVFTLLLLASHTARALYLRGRGAERPGVLLSVQRTTRIALASRCPAVPAVVVSRVNKSSSAGVKQYAARGAHGSSFPRIYARG